MYLHKAVECVGRSIKYDNGNNDNNNKNILKTDEKNDEKGETNARKKEDKKIENLFSLALGYCNDEVMGWRVEET